MIVFATDFGCCSPYTGQMEAVIRQRAPGVDIIHLFSDLPQYDPRASAYLLAMYVAEFPPDTVFLCVVDPGVGTDQRDPVVCRIDGRWYVGPNNGLFNVIAQRAEQRAQMQCWKITFAPAHLSNSFHGRDIFAPVAAGLALGAPIPGEPQPTMSLFEPSWPADHFHIVYTDQYGNAITGIRADQLLVTDSVRVREQWFSYAKVFAEVAPAAPFWYCNANGLVELAINRGNAAARFKLHTGLAVQIEAG